MAAGTDGLSPLQEALLTHASRIRIASAPTGAGKTYAFQRAVGNGKRVLFIVPTRRLAQNLAASLLEADGSCQVAIWTSDEKERLTAQSPEINIGRLRVRQLRGLEAKREGDIIIATPESVAWLLLRPSKPGVGERWTSIPDPVREFDHIVFDEFHTIDARGFGLAAALCKVVGSIAGEHGARITFLSATPIEIARVLSAFGVPQTSIVHLAETVITGSFDETGPARALHGDVTVSFRDAPDVAALAEACETQIRTCLEGGRQVILVFDALRDLLPAKEHLAAFFDRIGVPKQERLAINSTDDSATGGLTREFCTGRGADPLAYKVLVATSSIEVGVTFRAGLMIMDPGFDALSFVQRVGRVARGDKPGAVVVRVSPQQTNGKDWLRRLVADLSLEIAGTGSIPVRRFTELAMKSMAARFTPHDDLAAPSAPAIFRSMPMRAIWCSALFWAVMERNDKVTVGLRRTLESFRPPQAGYFLMHLKRLCASPLHSAKAWTAAFEAEALRLRSIPQHVTIKEPDGCCRRLTADIFECYEALMASPSFLENGNELVVIIDRPLEQLLRDSDRRFVDRKVEALFPHKTNTDFVPARNAANDWLRRASQYLRGARLQDQQDVLHAAIELVRLSGIVPEKRDSGTAGANLIL